MTRPWIAAVALVAGVSLAACSVPANDRARVVADDAVPFGLLDEDALLVVPTTAPPAEGEPVELCFVEQGRLVTLDVSLRPPVDLGAAIAALASPPEVPRLVRTALADPTVIRGVSLAAGIARVDLGASITDLGGDDQLLAVAQIVCTLTARPGVGQVSFTVEGAPVDVPRGDGSLVSHPVSRDDYQVLLG